MFSIFDINLADHGFYVNLKESVDRQRHVQSQIQRFNIKGLDRFEAIRNEHLPPASATDSQISVFELAASNNFETVAVFEDDFKLSEKVYAMRDPNILSYNLDEYLNIISKDLNSVNWDVLFLGFNPRKKCIPVTKNLSRVFKSTGAWAYIIKKSAYKYLIENTNYSRDRMAIDDLLPELTYRGFDCLATNLCIANHAAGFSSTMQPQLSNTDYREWILGNYHSCLWSDFSDDAITDVDIFLNNLWSQTNNSRNYKLKIVNFDGDITKLEAIDSVLPEYKNCYIELEPSEYKDLNYFMRIESRNLLHHVNEHNFDWIPQQEIIIDLAKI